MKKPLIGVVAKPIANEYEDWWHFMGVVDDIRLRLVEQGALVVGVLPTERRLDFNTEEIWTGKDLTIEELTDLADLVMRLDGIVLEGGLNANVYEREIAQLCIAQDIPLLGICSGFNNLVVATGGKVQHKATKLHQCYKQEIAHAVEVKPKTRLAEILDLENGGKVMVNSIHTEVTTPDMVHELQIAAFCPDDGTVEVVEIPNKRFIMGLKWHPELMESMRVIFQEFVKVCGQTK